MIGIIGGTGLYQVEGLEVIESREIETPFGHLGNLPLLRKAFQLGFKIGKREGTVTRIPADFLIHADGSIHTAFYGEKIGDHIPFESVMQSAVGGKEA